VLPRFQKTQGTISEVQEREKGLGFYVHASATERSDR
jgi:hypothetical protein